MGKWASGGLPIIKRERKSGARHDENECVSHVSIRMSTMHTLLLNHQSSFLGGFV